MAGGVQRGDPERAERQLRPDLEDLVVVRLEGEVEPPLGAGVVEEPARQALVDERGASRLHVDPRGPERLHPADVVGIRVREDEMPLALRNCRGGVDVVDLRRRPGRIDDEGVPVPEDDERVRLPLRRLEPLHAFGEPRRGPSHRQSTGTAATSRTGDPVPGSILSGNPKSVKRLPATASSGPTFSKCVTPSSRQTW